MTSIDDKRLVLIITCLTAFTTPFLSTSINIALPTINTDFAVPDQALLNWLVTSYLLVTAIFVVPFGRIADRYGLKKVFVTGLFIIVVSSILCAMSSSIFMLIASRAIEGIGSAMIFGTSMAILTSAYPLKERGKVLGIYMAVMYGGLSLGPSLGGFIVHFGSWRLIYAGIAVYALVVALLATWKIADEGPAAETGGFDLSGTVLYGAVLLFHTWPVQPTGNDRYGPLRAQPCPHGRVLLVGAAADQPGAQDRRLQEEHGIPVLQPGRADQL